MVCFFSDSSLICGYLVGHFIQFGFVCFCSDSSFVFIDGFFVSIDVVAVVSNLVGYSFDSIMYCGKAFVGICLVFIDGFFVGIDVFAVCFDRRQDIIAYAFCDFFKVFIQTADGIVKSIVGFGLFFQFFSIFVDGFFVSIDVFTVRFECRQDVIAYAFCDCFNVVLILVDGSFNSFQIFCVLVDNLGGFHQCFAVFIDGFGQVGKALVVFSYDFFQAQTAEVVGFNIVFCCFFCGNFVVFINVVDGVSGFESVDILGIVVGFNQGGFGNFFNVGNFCSGSFGFTGCSISFACCSFGFACGSFCSFYFGIDVLFGFFGHLFGFIGGFDSFVGLSVGFIQ